MSVDLNKEILKINRLDIDQTEKVRLIQQLLNPKKDNIKKKIIPYCSHYKRTYLLVADCCKNVYGCRFCHNENEDHKLNRNDTKYMKCSFCNCFQKIDKNDQIYCSNIDCYKFMKPELYNCNVCNLWFSDTIPSLKILDSYLIYNIDTKKECYHCNECGICRIGNRKDYIHCNECNLCINKKTFNTHICKLNVKEFNCPICLKDIWDYNDSPYVLKCGHSVHYKCFVNYINEGNNYKCPICKKSIVDMTHHWNMLDDFIKTQQVPEDSEYFKWKSKIYCNDCQKKCIVKYHFIYHKCKLCGSYNTNIDNIIKDI